MSNEERVEKISFWEQLKRTFMYPETMTPKTR